MPPQATFKDPFLLKLQVPGTSKEASRGSQLSSTLHPAPPFITLQNSYMSSVPTFLPTEFTTMTKWLFNMTRSDPFSQWVPEDPSHTGCSCTLPTMQHPECPGLFWGPSKCGALYLPHQQILPILCGTLAR